MLKIKQFCYPRDNLDFSQGEKDENGKGWSQNLIEGNFIYSLGIHSLPGNKFKINENPDQVLIINGTGNFSMDFGVYPIKSLQVYEGNLLETYPTIIDIVYQEGVIDSNG